MNIEGCEVRCTFLGKSITTEFRLHELLGLDPQVIKEMDEETLMSKVMDHIYRQKPQSVELWPLVGGSYPFRKGGS